MPLPVFVFRPKLEFINVLDNRANVDLGTFAVVHQINVDTDCGDDVIVIANPVTTPLDILGGEGNDTLDLSAVFDRVTTFIGPDAGTPALFFSIETILAGDTIFLPGAEQAGTIDVNGQTLDFSRLSGPLDLSGLTLQNVGQVFGPLFAPPPNSNPNLPAPTAFSTAASLSVSTTEQDASASELDERRHLTNGGGVPTAENNPSAAEGASSEEPPAMTVLDPDILDQRFAA